MSLVSEIVVVDVVVVEEEEEEEEGAKIAVAAADDDDDDVSDDAVMIDFAVAVVAGLEATREGVEQRCSGVGEADVSDGIADNDDDFAAAAAPAAAAPAVAAVVVDADEALTRTVLLFAEAVADVRFATTTTAFDDIAAAVAVPSTAADAVLLLRRAEAVVVVVDLRANDDCGLAIVAAGVIVGCRVSGTGVAVAAAAGVFAVIAVGTSEGMEEEDKLVGMSFSCFTAVVVVVVVSDVVVADAAAVLLVEANLGSFDLCDLS